jgi:hypothetical protein
MTCLGHVACPARRRLGFSPSRFVVIGFALVAGGNAFGWVAIGFFGLGVPLSVRQLIAPGSLTIDKTTIEVRHYW